jgi:hypothetical protein
MSLHAWQTLSKTHQRYQTSAVLGQLQATVQTELQASGFLFISGGGQCACAPNRLRQVCGNPNHIISSLGAQYTHENLFPIPPAITEIYSFSLLVSFEDSKQHAM